MNFVNYLSNSIIPIVITVIILYGVKEKIKVFDSFLEGAKEGMSIVVALFSDSYWALCSYRYFKKLWSY